MADEVKKESQKPRMLLSFIHPVGVMCDGRVLTTHAVIVEELFGAKTEVHEKEPAGASAKKLFWDTWRSKPPIHANLDFPLYVTVVSLGDQRDLKERYKLIVKYNNISAIMEL